MSVNSASSRVRTASFSPVPGKQPPVLPRRQSSIPTTNNASTSPQQQTQHINFESLLKRKLQNPNVKLSSDESIFLLDECIKKGEIQAAKADHKELTVFIGNTGSGKSTMINYLYGCKMQRIVPSALGINGLEKIVVVKPVSTGGTVDEIMPIGHLKQSMTFMPQIETDKAGITYCDCPGFLDNRGFEINTANAVNIKNVFIRAKSVKVVMLINYHSLLADRGRGLSDMIKISCSLFGSKENLIHYKDSIILGVTQVPLAGLDEGDEEGQQPSLNELKTWIRQTELSDSFEKSTLEHLSERLFIYDPLDNPKLRFSGSLQRNELIQNIRNLKKINNPLSIFKTVLTPDDIQGLISICDKIKGQIHKVISKANLVDYDFKQIAEYLKILKQLEIIEHPYVLELVARTQDTIKTYFHNLIHQFDVSCHDTSSKLATESKELLDQIKRGIRYFDEKIQAGLNVPELEKRYSLVIKKQEARTCVFELATLERKVRDFILGLNFCKAKEQLDLLTERIKFFEANYHETGIPHNVNLEELKNVYASAKIRYDDSLKKQQGQNDQLKRLEIERIAQQKLIEDQKKRAQEQGIERQKEREEADAAKQATIDRLKAKAQKMKEDRKTGEERRKKADEENQAEINRLKEKAKRAEIERKAGEERRKKAEEENQAEINRLKEKAERAEIERKAADEKRIKAEQALKEEQDRKEEEDRVAGIERIKLADPAEKKFLMYRILSQSWGVIHKADKWVINSENGIFPIVWPPPNFIPINVRNFVISTPDGMYYLDNKGLTRVTMTPKGPKVLGPQ